MSEPYDLNAPTHQSPPLLTHTYPRKRKFGSEPTPDPGNPSPPPAKRRESKLAGEDVAAAGQEPSFTSTVKSPAEHPQGELADASVTATFRTESRAATRARIANLPWDVYRWEHERGRSEMCRRDFEEITGQEYIRSSPRPSTPPAVRQYYDDRERKARIDEDLRHSSPEAHDPPSPAQRHTSPSQSEDLPRPNEDARPQLIPAEPRFPQSQIDDLCSSLEDAEDAAYRFARMWKRERDEKLQIRAELDALKRSFFSERLEVVPYPSIEDPRDYLPPGEAGREPSSSTLVAQEERRRDKTSVDCISPNYGPSEPPVERADHGGSPSPPSRGEGRGAGDACVDTRSPCYAPSLSPASAARRQRARAVQRPGQLIANPAPSGAGESSVRACSPPSSAETGQSTLKRKRVEDEEAGLVAPKRRAVRRCHSI